MKANLHILIFSLAASFYLAAGTYKASHFSHDFIPVYSSTRCLIHGCDPYDTTALSKQYVEGDGLPWLLNDTLWAEHPSVYPPSTFVVVFPLALLPFSVAAVLWSLLGGSALVAAMALVLSVVSKSASRNGVWTATLLSILMLLCGGYNILGGGNAVTIATAFAILGTVFFLTNRYILAAVVLFALSLAIKPQITGIVVLYLIMRGVHRKWAAVSLGGGATLLLLGILILQTSPGSHHWLASLRATLAEASLPGHANDPSPLNSRLGLINLQTITSVFLPSPGAYNAAALGLTGFLFVLWLISLRKMEGGAPKHLFALPPLLVLSLFPVYHRGYDDLLLVLSIPMIVVVLREHKFFGCLLILATSLPFLSGIIASTEAALIERSPALTSALSYKAGFILFMRPWTLELLVLFGLQLGAMRLLSDSLQNPQRRDALDLPQAATVQG